MIKHKLDVTFKMILKQIVINLNSKIYLKNFNSCKYYTNMNLLDENFNNCAIENGNFVCSNKQEQTNYIMNYLIKMSQLNKNKNIRISIEGNIASGKSSLIKYLNNKIDLFNEPNENSFKYPMKSANVNFNIIPEPVQLWRNLNGNNLLDLMYKDPHKWAFSFHSYVQLTMLENHLSILNQKSLNSENTISIMERSLYSARYCFVENIYRAEILKPVEYEILDKWYNWMIENNDCKLDIVFYLRTDPETCLKRLRERNRTEEIDRISLGYLKNLHDLHEKWLFEQKSEPFNYYKPKTIIVINANQPADEVYKSVENETRNAAFMKN